MVLVSLKEENMHLKSEPKIKEEEEAISITVKNQMKRELDTSVVFYSMQSVVENKVIR